MSLLCVNIYGGFCVVNYDLWSGAD